MAESIHLHFLAASAAEVLSRVAVITEKVPGREQYFYPSEGDYVLLISAREDYVVEYDEGERIEIERTLGGKPCASLDFELRRSRSDAACDAAVKIIKQLAVEFTFVVDDCDRFWSASEAVSASHFLDLYRYAKRA